jgi:ligand-binding SRPBCC domain-containing protein
MAVLLNRMAVSLNWQQHVHEFEDENTQIEMQQQQQLETEPPGVNIAHFVSQES